MTVKKESTEHKPVKIDLSAHYRPLGLKAVLAAHLMLKDKPKKTLA